jgi:predicted secreted protein
VSRGARVAFGVALLSSILPVSAMAETAVPTVLHLSDTAHRSVPRDRLTIDMRTEATGTDPRLVQAEVNRRMAAALGKAKSTPAVTAASGSYYTYSFTPTGKDGKPAPPEQWRAAQNLSLTSGNFAAELLLAGQLQADGLLISGMEFSVSPDALRAVQQALTQQALTEITTRAAQIAAVLDLKMTGITSLTVGTAGTEGHPPIAMMARAAGTAETMPPPAVAAGDSIVSVSIQADIRLTSAP